MRLIGIGLIMLSILLGWYVMIYGWGIPPKDWGVIVVGTAINFILAGIGHVCFKAD